MTDDFSLNNEFGKHFTQKSNVHMSLSSDLLVVSEDKLHLCLRDHLQQIDARRAWQFPIGIFITSLLALVTTDFKGGLGLDGPVWKAVFVLLTVVSAVATAYFGWFAARAKSDIKIILANLREGALLIRDGKVQPKLGEKTTATTAQLPPPQGSAKPGE
jgi:hypothetical protein